MMILILIKHPPVYNGLIGPCVLVKRESDLFNISECAILKDSLMGQGAPVKRQWDHCVFNRTAALIDRDGEPEASFLCVDANLPKVWHLWVVD